MLELADLTADDVIYDLGCRDGRVIIRAAKNYGARGVGVDVEQYWVEQARSNAQAAGVGELVQFTHADALTIDLGQATVITLYLVHWSTQLVWSTLTKRTRAGVRVVSHNYPLERFAAEPASSISDAAGKVHRLYRQVVGDPETTSEESVLKS